MLKKFIGLLFVMILLTSVAFATSVYNYCLGVGQTYTHNSFSEPTVTVVSGNENIQYETTGSLGDYKTFITALQEGSASVNIDDGFMDDYTYNFTITKPILFVKDSTVKLTEEYFINVPNFDLKSYVANSTLKSILYDYQIYEITTIPFEFCPTTNTGNFYNLRLVTTEPGVTYTTYYNYYPKTVEAVDNINVYLGDKALEVNDFIGEEDLYGDILPSDTTNFSLYQPDSFIEDGEYSKEGIITAIILDKTNKIPYYYCVNVKEEPTPITDIYVPKFYKAYLGRTYDPVEKYIYSVNYGADPKAVTIESSDDDVAEITKDGMIKATGIGDCTITITSNDDPTISESFTWYTRPYYAVGNGEKFVDQPIINLKYDDNGDEIEEFNNIISNSNPDILDATVSGDNEITFTGKGEGYATIKIDQYNKPGVYRYITVNCVNSLVPVYKNKEVKIPTSLIYSTVGLWGGQLDKGSLTEAWVVDNEDQWTELTFDKNSIKFTPTEAGCYWLWVADKDNNSCYYYLYVEDKIPVKSVKLDKSYVKVLNGESVQLNATVLPEDATYKTVKWSSSKKSVATVDKKGLVKTKNTGATTIYCISKDNPEKYDICNIVSYIKLNIVSTNNKTISKVNVKKGRSTKVVADIKGLDYKKGVTWKSSNKNIARVDANGVITGIKAGKVTITATSKYDKKESAKINVTVYNK